MNEIILVLDFLRIRQPNIGEYVTHTSLGPFDFAVKLSNGRISIPGKAITDYPNILQQDIQNMIASFQSM